MACINNVTLNTDMGAFFPLRESGKIEEQLQLQQENVIFKERHFFGGINLRHLHIYPDLKRLKSHRDVWCTCLIPSEGLKDLMSVLRD